MTFINRLADIGIASGAKRSDDPGFDKADESRSPRTSSKELQQIIRKAEERGEVVAALFRLVIFLALVSVDLGEGLSVPTNHPFVVVITTYGVASGLGLFLAWRGVQFGLLPYLLAGLDVVVLAASVSMVERMVGVSHDHAMTLPMFSLIFLMLIHASMRYKPRLVVYAAGLFLSSLLLFDWVMSGSMPSGPMARPTGGPAFVSGAPLSPFDLLHYRTAPIIFVGLAAILLFYVTTRTRRLLQESILQERRVARLSRFFPQNVVEHLASFESPVRTPRMQRIAVLFADVVGFTRLVETATSDEIIGFLREFHQVMEEAVFDSGGTLEKFMGDGIMATFGTPTAGRRDATSALDCALDMFDAVDRWNARRSDKGLPSIRLSVGIHHGEALLGEIGSARRLELAVVGDVVNVASRLEALTRRLGCQLVVSDDFVRAVREEGAQTPHAILASLCDAGRQALHGRAEGVAVWTWGTVDTRPPDEKAIARPPATGPQFAEGSSCVPGCCRAGKAHATVRLTVGGRPPLRRGEFVDSMARDPQSEGVVMASPHLFDLTSLLDNAKCYEMIRQHRWPNGVCCPRCASQSIVRDGRDETQRDRQRYRCGTCGGRFDDLTSTVLAGHRQPLRVWVLCLYLMGLNLSNQQIARELSLNGDDVQAMTSQLREGLVARSPEVVLDGEVEVDEVYIVAGHKGNPAAVKKKTARAGVAGSKGRRAAARSRRKSHRSSG